MLEKSNLEKLKSLSKEEQLKLLYMWVKQQHINLSQFKSLIEWVSQN